MPQWSGSWDGGRTYQTKDGRTVWVLRRGAGGRVQITLNVRTEDDAKAELALYNRDPDAYVAAAADRATDARFAQADGPVRVDARTIDRFIKALQAEGLTERYVGNVEYYLAAWSHDLKGRDLRRVSVRELNTVLDSYPREVRDPDTGRPVVLAAARKHRISALKSLTAWLRKRGELVPADDASLSLQVPPPRPEKARRFAAGGAKGYSIAQIERLYAALDGWPSKKFGWKGTERRVDVQCVRDVLLLHAKTGMHATEIERLARGEGRLDQLAGQGGIAGTITFIHKHGGVHVQSVDAQAVAAVKRLQARGSAPVDSYIRKVVQRAADKLGMKTIRFGELRHSFVTWARECGEEVRASEGGLSLDAIAAAIGHQSVRTTSRHYDQTKVPPMIRIPIRLVHADDPPVADAPTREDRKRPRRNTLVVGSAEAQSGAREGRAPTDG